MMKAFVKIRTTFEGIHRWVDAPDQMAFLRNYHRHLFYVTLTKEVQSLDRQIEIICLKRSVTEYLNFNYGPDKPTDKSCEQIAEDLWFMFSASMVEVLEDDENGAIITGTLTDREVMREQREHKEKE